MTGSPERDRMLKERRAATEWGGWLGAVGQKQKSVSPFYTDLSMRKYTIYYLNYFFMPCYQRFS